MKIPNGKSTISTIFAGGDGLLRCMEFCEFQKSQDGIVDKPLGVFVFGPSRLPDVTLGKTMSVYLCIHDSQCKSQGTLRLCQMPLA